MRISLQKQRQEPPVQKKRGEETPQEDFKSPPEDLDDLLDEARETIEQAEREAEKGRQSGQ